MDRGLHRRKVSWAPRRRRDKEWIEDGLKERKENQRRSTPDE